MMVEPGHWNSSAATICINLLNIDNFFIFQCIFFTLRNSTLNTLFPYIVLVYGVVMDGLMMVGSIPNFNFPTLNNNARC